MHFSLKVKWPYDPVQNHHHTDLAGWRDSLLRDHKEAKSKKLISVEGTRTAVEKSGFSFTAHSVQTTKYQCRASYTIKHQIIAGISGQGYFI